MTGITSTVSQFNKAKNDFLDLIKDIPSDTFNEKASADEWSAAQVVAHLIDSETGISKYIYTKTKDLDSLADTGLKHAINSILLNLNLKSNKKFKAPKVVSQPENSLGKEELIEKWDATRNRFLETLEAIPTASYKKAIFKHPKVGYLNIRQTVTFMTHHITHHVKQVDRIKSRF